MIDLKELEELDRKRKMLRAIVLKDSRFGFDKGLTYMTKVYKDNVNVSFSLKLNFSKENDHLKRWNKLYRVSNINEVIEKINGE